MQGVHDKDPPLPNEKYEAAEEANRDCNEGHQVEEEERERVPLFLAEEDQVVVEEEQDEVSCVEYCEYQVLSLIPVVLLSRIVIIFESFP